MAINVELSPTAAIARAEELKVKFGSDFHVYKPEDLQSAKVVEEIARRDETPNPRRKFSEEELSNNFKKIIRIID